MAGSLLGDILRTVLVIPKILLKLAFRNLDRVPAGSSGLGTHLEPALIMNSLAIRPQPIPNRLVSGRCGELGVIKDALRVSKHSERV